MTRSDQMVQQILIVDLSFPEATFYIVIFIVPLSPKTFITLSLIYFYCHCVFGLAQSPVADGNLGSGILWSGETAARHIMKNNFFKLLNSSQGWVSPKKRQAFYKYWLFWITYDNVGKV